MAPVAASPTPIVTPLPAVPPTTAPKDKKAAARKRFEAVYTVVRDDLLADFRKHNMPEEAIEYYRRVRTPAARVPLI
jgi:farnesyl diphosphate synthase